MVTPLRQVPTANQAGSPLATGGSHPGGEEIIVPVPSAGNKGSEVAHHLPKVAQLRWARGGLEP